MKKTSARTESGAISLTAAAIVSIGLAVVVTVGAATFDTGAFVSVAAPAAPAAPAAAPILTLPVSAPVAAPPIKQVAPTEKFKKAAAPISAATPSGPGSGCLWSYSVGAPGVWVDDQQGQQFLQVSFLAGLVLDEDGARRSEVSPGCAEYDAIHEDFIAYLVGSGVTKGRYVNAWDRKPYRSTIWVGNPYDSTTPGALTNASIEAHGERPQEVADGFEAWMAETYPGAELVGVSVAGYDPDPAVNWTR